MSSTITHAASCSIVALTSAHISSDETSYVFAALIAASILDLDHLVFIIRDREIFRRTGFAGNLHNARSYLHELLGVLLAGCLALVIFFFDPRLAFVVFIALTLHIVQDWILGKSTPLAPFDKTIVQLFPLTQTQKIVIDLVLFFGSGILWLSYLNGAR